LECVVAGDWLPVAKAVIEQRISRYSGDEISFNLMAVVSDRIAQSEKQLTELAAVS